MSYLRNPENLFSIANGKLYKSTFIRRMSGSEATKLEEILLLEEPYIRLLFNSVEWFDISDALISS